MMTGGGSRSVAGGPARHLPVLARSAVAWLNVRAGGIYVDATFGAGGYARAILATPGASVLGIDTDRSAIVAGAALIAAAQGRLALVEGRFANLESILKQRAVAAVDGVVFDLGISSMQLDRAERGFSFSRDGPLDMRMGGTGPSAADVVARASERELAAIIATFGEERMARAIARAIVKGRQERPIDSTRALADIVTRVLRTRAATIHPATRTFQALRIFINDELAQLAQGLIAAEHVLKPGGRLVVVAFHSLEDRIVKAFLSERSRAPSASRHRPQVAAEPATFRVLTQRPQTPEQDEIACNPRARSARLRAAERTGAVARDAPAKLLLPPLPSLADVMRRQA